MERHNPIGFAFMRRRAEQLFEEGMKMCIRDRYEGVDIPVLLNSTPAETLAHRQARNRDGRADSPFTTMVLELELSCQMDRGGCSQM